MVGERAQGEERFLVSRLSAKMAPAHGREQRYAVVRSPYRSIPACSFFSLFLLSARIVCARRNTVDDSGLPLCLE